MNPAKKSNDEKLGVKNGEVRRVASGEANGEVNEEAKGEMYGEEYDEKQEGKDLDVVITDRIMKPCNWRCDSRELSTRNNPGVCGHNVFIESRVFIF